MKAYETFGFEYGRIDRKLLNERRMMLLKRFHPDNYSNSTDNTIYHMTQITAQINNSFSELYNTNNSNNSNILKTEYHAFDDAVKAKVISENDTPQHIFPKNDLTEEQMARLSRFSSKKIRDRMEELLRQK